MIQQQVKQRAKPPIGTYVDPMSDFGFKHIFGREPHKDLLIDFLNQLLSKKGKHIVDLTYNKNEFPGPKSDARKTIYDLPVPERTVSNLSSGYSALPNHFLEKGRYFMPPD